MNLISLAKAAERLDVSGTTLRRWVHLGLIEAVVLPSGRMRFDPSEVERILTPKRTTP